MSILATSSIDLKFEPLVDNPVMDGAAKDNKPIGSVATDGAASDTAAIDNAVMDDLAANRPVIDSPAVDTATTDGPTIDGSSADDPVIDNPVTDEPAIDNPGFKRVRAVHPHWDGFLLLSDFGASVVHEELKSRGTYQFDGDTLTVFWDNYQPDVFQRFFDVFIHQEFLKHTPKLEKMCAVTIADRLVLAKRICVSIPNFDYEVDLRLGTTDVPTFEQIFVQNEYDSPNLPDSAETIVDLGANIGLAAVFFGLKYGSAKILAVEPEASNFALLSANTTALRDRVKIENAAAWTTDGFINLHTESEEGHALGAWGVQVSDRAGRNSTPTRCFRLPSLINVAQFDAIDILKVDIEGAELEIFSNGSAEWLPRVKLVIVETHDRFRPGTEEAVRNALGPMFEELPRRGENLFFRRIAS